MEVQYEDVWPSWLEHENGGRSVVTDAAEQSCEAQRIQFLLERDGYESTRAWVERTLQLYRNVAPDSLYRRGFEHSVHDFEQWLSTHPAAPTSH
jgi:hypothetical protein